MFLLENDDWWDIDLVQEMVTGLWKKERLRIYNYDEADEEYEGDLVKWIQIINTIYLLLL
jgi:hypothetical protein